MLKIRLLIEREISKISYSDFLLVPLPPGVGVGLALHEHVPCGHVALKSIKGQLVKCLFARSEITKSGLGTLNLGV